MTNRMVIGKRGSEMGLWLSKSGIDVLTAEEKDLLVSSSETRFAFLTNGEVVVPHGGNATVNYPVTLTNEPLLLLQPIYFGTGFTAAYVPVGYYYSTGGLNVIADLTFTAGKSSFSSHNPYLHDATFSYMVAMLRQ